MIPAHRWPALRRLVKARRIIWAAYDVLGFLARIGAYWLAMIGFCYLLRHPAPVEPATLMTGFGAAIGLFFEVRERVTRRDNHPPGYPPLIARRPRILRSSPTRKDGVQ